MNYKTNKKELCVRSVYNIYPKWKEFAQIHDWIYNEDYTTECSQCHAKGNFKVKELIEDEYMYAINGQGVSASGTVY